MDEFGEHLIDINLVMPDGVVHSPVKICSMTDNDLIKISDLLSTAEKDGHWNRESGDLHFDGLADPEWYWEFMGGTDRDAFQRLSDSGIHVQGYLYLRNPGHGIEVNDGRDDRDDLGAVEGDDDLLVVGDDDDLGAVEGDDELLVVGDDDDLGAVEGDDDLLVVEDDDDQAAEDQEIISEFEHDTESAKLSISEKHKAASRACVFYMDKCKTLEEKIRIQEEYTEALETKHESLQEKHQILKNYVAQTRFQEKELEMRAENAETRVVQLLVELKQMKEKKSGTNIQEREGKSPSPTALDSNTSTLQESSGRKRQLEDDDSDSEPIVKRRRSVMKHPGGPGRGGKTRPGETTGILGKPTRAQGVRDEEKRSSAQIFPGYRIPKLNPAKSSSGRGSSAPKSKAVLPVTGRSTNNSRNSFLDNWGHASPIKPSGFADFRKSGSTSQTKFSNNMDERPGPKISTAHVPKETLTGTQPTSLSNSHQSPPSVASAVTTQPALSDAMARVQKSRGWSERESQALIKLMKAHRQQPDGPDGKKPELLHDVKLFNLMSLQLMQEFQIVRSPNACKNEWNRRGRQASGVDNRKIPNPNKLSTSVQGK